MAATGMSKPPVEQASTAEIAIQAKSSDHSTPDLAHSASKRRRRVCVGIEFAGRAEVPDGANGADFALDLASGQLTRTRH